MITLVAVPLLSSLLLAVLAGPIARRVRPTIAVPLITGLALSSALCTGLVLSVTAVLAAAQLGPFPHHGQWSRSALHTASGFPLALGMIALLIVAGCLTAATVQATRWLRALRLVRRACAVLSPSVGNLVLLRDPVPVAYSLAGAGGRIVVSTGMFAALSAPQRRVLLAHESAHLTHRHSLYRHLTSLAAAANPLLRPAVGAVTLATERWADEAAASEVGDRELVARALAQASMAAAKTAVPLGALAAADHGVADRVRLLLSPPKRPRGYVTAAVLTGLASWATTAVITLWANDVVQFAENVYTRR